MPGPAYLIVALKIQNRDSTYIEDQLRGLHTSITPTSLLKRHARRVVAGIKELLNGSVSGVHAADLWVAVPGTNAVLPARTITCTTATSAGKVVTFACGGQTITLTEGVDFIKGATDTTEATALAAAINANTTLNAIFTTASATNVVTLTGKFPGLITGDWTITGDTGLVVASSVTGTEGTARIPFRNVLLNHTP